MKSKILLITVSTVLVLALAIGGTLMLFTSESAVATNVVTLGDMEVRFFEGANAVNPMTSTEIPTETPTLYEIGVQTREEGFTDPDGSQYNFAGAGSKFSGIEFTNEIVPNAIISKVPVIRYTGVPGYLRVKADVIVSNNNDPVDISDLDSSDELQTILSDIYKSIDLSPDFKPVQIGDDGLSYYFYYAPNNTLTAFTETSGTGQDGEIVLFHGFKIEDYTDGDILDAFAELKGYTVELKLQVQAIQSEWNNQAEGATWGAYFAQLDT